MYYSKGRMMIFSLAFFFFKNSFFCNIKGPFLQEKAATIVPHPTEPAQTVTFFGILTQLTHFGLVPLQWMKTSFTTYYYRFLRLRVPG